MTRKDYVVLAEALGKGIRTAGTPLGRVAVEDVKILIANALQDENPRFNRATFYAAVYAAGYGHPECRT